MKRMICDVHFYNTEIFSGRCAAVKCGNAFFTEVDFKTTTLKDVLTEIDFNFDACEHCCMDSVRFHINGEHVYAKDINKLLSEFEPIKSDNCSRYIIGQHCACYN